MLFIDEIHRLSRAGRGGALPGDGGLPARHRAGQGPGRPLDPPRPAPLHPRRRHHPHRAHHRPAPRPLRSRRPARLLRRRPTSRRSSCGPPASSASSIDAAGAAEIARRARGTPRIANRLLRRVRDFAEVRGDGTHRRARSPATGLAAVRRRRARPRQGRPGRSSSALCERFGGGPVGLSTLAISVSASRPRPSRTSTSRSSSSRACSCARRGAGSPRRRRGPTSA